MDSNDFCFPPSFSFYLLNLFILKYAPSARPLSQSNPLAI